MFYNKMLYIIIDTNKSDIKMNRRNRERNRQRMRDKRTEPDTSSTQVTHFILLTFSLILENNIKDSQKLK